MKFHRVRSGGVGVLAAVVLPGCISYQTHDTQTVTTTTRTENRPDCVAQVAQRLRQVRHAQPLVGLFIGISNYGAAAGYSPTPAHTISAALFREPFYLTAVNDAQKSDLRLSSSLELDAGTAFGRAAEHTLRAVGGMAQELNATAGDKSPVGDRQYLRNARPTTRRNLLEELDRSLDRAEAVAQKEGQVVFIFYVSAHGRLGADGRAYIVPTDANRDDPASWIDQQLVLARTAAFLSRSLADGRGRKAVLVFDMCRVPQGDVPQRMAVGAPRALANAFVVESTSPGSYAWHWTMQSDTHSKVEVVSESRFGFPLPPPKSKEGGVIDERFAANMSIAPLASNCAISEFFAAQAKAAAAKASAASGTDRATAAPLQVADWLTESAEWLPAFARLIPEVKESGSPQEMRLFVSSTLQPIPLLQGMPR